MTNWFNLPVIALITILCIIAVILTYWVLKQQEQKMRELEEKNDSAKDEFERSLKYEKESWRKGIPGITWIYVITTVVSLVIFLFFMYSY